MPIARFLTQSFDAERDRWGLWLPVFLSIGIGFYFQLQNEPQPWLAPAAIALCIGSYLTARGTVWAGICVVAGTMALGVVAADVRTETVSKNDTAVPNGVMTITGPVIRNEQRSSQSRLVIRVTPSGGALRAFQVRISVAGRQNSANRVRVGDTVRLRAVMRAPPPPVMPGAFDLQRHAYFQGIDAVGFAVSPVEIISLRSNHSAWAGINPLRQSVTDHILRSQPNQSGAIAAALLTGHRGHLNDETLGAMRDSGIAHLLAISGLHIGLVAGLAFTAVRFLIALIQRLALSLNGKKVAACVALAAAFSYAMLAGFTVPTQRAFLMSGLVLVAVLLDRRAISLRSVAIAAGAILLVRPESLLQPGFQMSFAAVTALVSAHVAYTSFKQNRDAPTGPKNHVFRIFQYLGSVMIVSLIAGIATAPFAIYHFQHVSAFGMIANLLAVPIAAFWVIPSGMLTLFAMTVGAESMPLAVMCAGIDLILAVARWTAALPAAAMDIAAPPMSAMMLITLGALWFAIWQRIWRLWGIPIIAIGVWSSVYQPIPDIIVDGAARLVSVRDSPERQYLSSRKRARFSAEIWARRSGLSETADLLEIARSSAQQNVGCDSAGCVLNKNGKRIAIAFEHSALIDDCTQSDFVIALVPIRKFCSARRIDRFDLWRNGTHAIYINENDITVESVNEFRGTRPWTRSPVRKRKNAVNILGKAP